MGGLQAHFLGTLDIHYDGRQLTKPATLKSQSLLAYLILHRDQPQPRDRLVGLFWGNRPERKARSSLSTALWHIRCCLPDERFILSDPHTVQVDPQVDLWLDVDEFESHASRDDIAGLQSAVALYRGDFLDGFYDEWIINERYRLEALLLETLARLMAGREARGEHEAALATALRLLDHDPLREDAHRAVMRAYCRLGHRNSALNQYRRCQEILQQELDVKPMVETTELHQAILEGRFLVSRVPELVPAKVPVAAAPTVPGHSPLDVVARTRLVCREQELAFLHACWQKTSSRARREAEAGRAVFLLIGGEAGVGKTRLVEEFANCLHWQGVRVLWGRCYEFERVLPYQPFAEALRTILPAWTPAELASFPAWTIEEVGRLVPELSDQLVLGDTRPERSRRGSQGAEGRHGRKILDVPSLGQEEARFFEGVAQFLAELSSHGPFLIVLEDLHWASESTLQLLHYLARHLADYRVLVVGSFRPEAIEPQHPLLILRRRLTREGLAKPLRLSRLSPAAVAAMMVHMSGRGEAVMPLATRLYQETEGNPFFVMEIVKALFETGVINLEAGAWRGNFARISEGEIPLPASVADAIEARVRRLDSDAQEALRLAAVLGREFDFELLNAVWGRGEETTLEALDDLLRHRLLDEGTGPMGRDYMFTHHKIQEVVYAAMGRRRQQYTHGLVGATMQELCGPETEALAGELAFHFEHGRRLDETLTEKAITYLLQAGDKARGLYACREAIGYYQRALSLLKEQGQYERAARTLIKMGLTYHYAFDFRQARRAYEEGFALWQRTGGTEPLVSLPPAPHALRVSCSDPVSLDPTVSGDIMSIPVIDQLFSGLVEHSPEMDIVPHVAQTWEVLDGGRRYVFHLRGDVRWSDGTPVTAEDFEYAWKRTLNPATGSPNAGLLYDVKGARAFHRGEAVDSDCVGVQALDEVTLVVELDEPTAYFLHLLACTATCPVPRHAVEAHGQAWTEVGNIVTNGPFRLEAWQPGESLALVHDPQYHGRLRGNLRRVEPAILADSSAGQKAYEADELDILDMTFFPPVEIDHVRRQHAGEYVSLPRFFTSYVAFCLSRTPFDDARVRRAFALATDRERLADVILRGYGSPATGGFVPPRMPGHTPGIGLPYDPERARQFLADAGYPGGQGFPAVDLMMHSDFLSPVASEYLQGQWQEDLGIEVRSEAVEWEEFLERLQTAPPHMLIWGWVADYPDPDNFLRLGMSYVLRYTHWDNGDYERLVEEARRITDQDERMKLYRQADKILIEEAPVLPLAYMRSHLLVKPWVRKLPLSAINYWLWKDVIVEPH
jgi:oligopeptide transport system substrate-binding protein